MEFSPEYWPSHKQGERTRTAIEAYIREHPQATLEEVAAAVGRSLSTVQRQLKNLRAEGRALDYSGR